MVRPAAITLLMLVGACERPVNRSEATAIAEDMADEHARRLESRVEELEQRVEIVASGRESMLRYSNAIHEAGKAETAARKAEDESLAAHYNDHLYRFHGVQRPAPAKQ